MSKQLYDVELVVHRETNAAWQVSETGDVEETIWIPKSQAEIYEKVGDHKWWPIHKFTMPEWLAKEKELI